MGTAVGTAGLGKVNGPNMQARSASARQLAIGTWSAACSEAVPLLHDDLEVVFVHEQTGMLRAE